MIRVISVQGLRKPKAKEVEELITGNALVCLPEIQTNS